MKVKFEPILAKLDNICRELTCYSIIHVVKKNSLSFCVFFCCSDIFEWDY